MRWPTHTKKHLQRALKAPCRCLKRRTGARAGRTAIAFVERLRPLECVCYTFIWFYQIKDVKTYTIFCCYSIHSCCFENEHRAQRYKLLLKVANLFALFYVTLH